MILKKSQKISTNHQVRSLWDAAQHYHLLSEGALKLKEISYIHAEGIASGELKHGAIALVDKKLPVIVLAPDDIFYVKNLSNMNEVYSRGGKIILVGKVQNDQLKDLKLTGINIEVNGKLNIPIIMSIKKNREFYLNDRSSFWLITWQN